MKIPKSSIINHKSQSLRDFVNEFNFPDPNWEKLPNGFPNLSKDALTKEENHLLDAIILAWMATHKKGQFFILKNTVKNGFFAIAILGTITFTKNFIKSPGFQYARQVSAATISATLKTSGIQSSASELNDIFESTISGVLKPKKINKNYEK